MESNLKFGQRVVSENSPPNRVSKEIPPTGYLLNDVTNPKCFREKELRRNRDSFLCSIDERDEALETKPQEVHSNENLMAEKTFETSTPASGSPRSTSGQAQFSKPKFMNTKDKFPKGPSENFLKIGPRKENVLAVKNTSRTKNDGDIPIILRKSRKKVYRDNRAGLVESTGLVEKASKCTNKKSMFSGLKEQGPSGFKTEDRARNIGDDPSETTLLMEPFETLTPPDSFKESILADLNPELFRQTMLELGISVEEPKEKVPLPDIEPLPDYKPKIDCELEDVEPEDVFLTDTSKYIFKSVLQQNKGAQSHYEDYRLQMAQAASISQSEIELDKKRLYRKKINDSSLKAWYQYNVIKSAECQATVEPEQETQTDFTPTLTTSLPKYDLAEKIWQMNKVPEVPSVKDVFDGENSFAEDNYSEAMANLAIVESSSSLGDSNNWQSKQFNYSFEPSEFLGSSTPITGQSPKDPDDGFLQLKKQFQMSSVYPAPLGLPHQQLMTKEGKVWR